MHTVYIYILNHCFQSSSVINCSCLSVPSVNVSCPFSQSSVIAPYCSLVFQPICHCSCNCFLSFCTCHSICNWFLSYLSLHLQLIPFLPVTPYATVSWLTCPSAVLSYLSLHLQLFPFLPVPLLSFPTCHSICNWFNSTCHSIWN